MKNDKFYLSIMVIIIVSIFCISIGYSALTATLDINGSVSIIPAGDIYIRAVNGTYLSSNATESFSPSFEDNTISFGGTLPELTSKATYYLAIKNNTNVSKKLSSVTINTNNNENTTFTTAGISANTIVAANSEAYIEVTIKYKDTVASLPTNIGYGLNLTFNFVNEGTSEQKTYQSYDTNGLILNLRGYDAPVNSKWVDTLGNQLTLNGNCTQDSTTNSYTFDGNGDYAVATQAFIPATSDFTAEIYLKTQSNFSSLTSSDQAILTQVADASNSAGRFKINLRKNITNGVTTAYANGGFAVFWNNSYAKTNVFYDYNNSVSDSTIYGITLVRTNHNMYFYVNGVLNNTQTGIDVDGTLASIGQEALKLGKFNNKSTQYFTGSLYAVRIYNRALTADEILTNYNKDAYNYEPPVIEDTNEKLYDNIIANSYTTSTDSGLHRESDKLIFKGSSPNNYLKIEDETYRIMSISGDNMKLVRVSNPIAMAYDTYDSSIDRGTYCSSYQTSGCNAWTTYDSLTTGTYTGTVNSPSSINTYLNGTFYSGLSTTLKGLMKTTTLNVGPVDEAFTYDTAHQQELTKTWSGNVGLMTLCDILDASISKSWVLNQKLTDNYLNNDYFLGHYWTSTQSTLDNWDVWILTADNRKVIAERRASRTDQVVSGTTIPFYAEPLITVSKTMNVTGTGTSADPYTYVA